MRFPPFSVSSWFLYAHFISMSLFGPVGLVEREFACPFLSRLFREILQKRIGSGRTLFGLEERVNES